MPTLRNKIRSFLEYFGIESGIYDNIKTPFNDSKNELSYHLDMTGRLSYPGPYEDGLIPMLEHGGEKKFHIALVSMFALGQLEIYLKEKDSYNLDNFIKICDLLIDRQDSDGLWWHQSVVTKFGVEGKSVSAMSQGLALSCLSRAYAMTENNNYRNAAFLGVSAYDKDINDGGVSSFEDGMIFFEEYPVYPVHHVLNGFFYALWGLYDLHKLTDHSRAGGLYKAGLDTIIKKLHEYDNKFWSLYSIGPGTANPATPHYHRLHIEQLKVMEKLNDNPVFTKYRKSWEQYEKHTYNRLRTLPLKIKWRMSR